MTPTVTKKGSRHYRYYTSMDAIRNRACEGRDSFVRLNAGMVEGAVVQHIRSLLRSPEIAARAMEAIRRTTTDMDEQDVVSALAGFDGLWESLFPAEQARIARLLIERVTGTEELCRRATMPSPHLRVRRLRVCLLRALLQPRRVHCGDNRRSSGCW